MTIKRLLSYGLLSVMILITGCSKNADDNNRNYYSEISSVNKLVLARMSISKMATIDDVDLSEARGVKQIAVGVIDALKLGKRRGAYSYNTYLQAYVDLSAFQPEDVIVDRREKTITVNLPPIKTEFAGRDMAITEEHYRVTGLRSDIDPKERAILKEKMNESLKNEVERKPFFREQVSNLAREKAESYFKSVLATEGYDVIVKFK